MFSSVDLPEPDLPSSATRSPRRTSSETPRRAWTAAPAGPLRPRRQPRPRRGLVADLAGLPPQVEPGQQPLRLRPRLALRADRLQHRLNFVGLALRQQRPRQADARREVVAVLLHRLAV